MFFPIFQSLGALICIFCAFSSSPTFAFSSRAEPFDSKESSRKILSEIKRIDSIQGIEKYTEPGTWILIDLDFTLFEAASPTCHASWFYNRVKELIAQGQTKEEAIRNFYPEWIIKQKNCPVKPIEERMLAFIRLMQARGITVMGFTSRQKPIVDSTLSQIDSLKIDFSKTAPISRYWEKATIKCPIVFKRGVLFACDYNEKGEVLEQFLTSTKTSPAKIILFDDGLENIESVKKSALSLSIPYLGFHYTAYHNINSQ